MIFHKRTLIIVLLSVASIVFVSIYINDLTKTPIHTFEKCADEGGNILESEPRRCITRDGDIFTENIGGEDVVTDKIRVLTPLPNDIIKSPLVIKGEARGYWFFEADFPIKLLDEKNNEIAFAIAQAKGEWMTEEFVPFEATIIFTNPKGARGTLVFEKNNPSGLDENFDSLFLPIRFNGMSEDPDSNIIFCTQDAKLCPDGSYVGRVGPNCEFSKCPGESKKEAAQQ